MILANWLNQKYKLLILLCFGLCVQSGLRAQLWDNFDDGNFSSNPIWTGTTENFIVNAQGQLQLTDTDPVQTQSYLATESAMSSLDNREWRIWVKQSFAGSDNNHSRIYLSSNGNSFSYTGNNSAGVQGYYLKLGEAGSADVLRFYRDDGTSTALIASGTTLIASAFTMRIRIIRDDAGNWIISSDNTGGENFITETSFTETTYTTSSHFGIVCTYTGSNASGFYFDDIYAGDVILDTTPPEVVSLNATSANSLDILMNENLDVASVQTLVNYSVSNGMGNPSFAILDGGNPALIHLSFNSSFTPNQAYTLTIQNLADESGNAMSQQNINFTYHVFSEASYRDVIFNEILADPSPAVGLPEAEFVELFNAHPIATFNLNGWEFVNTNTVKTLPEFNLAPGAFVILCDANNAALFEDYGDVIGIPSFVALANAADSLTLKKPNGEIIDVVSYKDSWFDTPSKKDGGWSLELINPDYPCQSSVNWRESQNPEGGTPGAINSVYDNTLDTTAPEVVSVEVLSLQSVRIVFSEEVYVFPTSFSEWEITPDNHISAVELISELREVIIHLQNELVPPNSYQITIVGVGDCSGNIMDTEMISFTIAYQPEPGDLAINEIMANPTPALMMPAAEYVELRNNTSKLLDISSLKLNNGNFVGQVLLEADSFVVVAHLSNASFFANIPNVAFMNSFPSLTNSGMLLELKNSSGIVFDSVNYSDTWYKDDSKKNGGWSLELINPYAPCSGSYNWRASGSALGGTAGYENSVFDDSPNSEAPKFQYFYWVENVGILCYFDRPLGEEFLDNITFSVNAVVQAGIYPEISGPEGNAILIHYNAVQPGHIYFFTLQGVSDCWGNTADAVVRFFGQPEEAEAGDIIINEVLHNPFDGGSDFVEIYNRSKKILSLNNWKIADATSGSMNTPRVIATDDLLLMPGDYLALTRKPESLAPFYPGTVSENVWQVSDLPDFSASDEVFLLFENLSTLSDHLAYDPDMHYPLLNSTKGISLERISANRPTDDRSNWHSASSSDGYATPGYRNSQSQEGVVSDAEFSVSPEIFSPDNDGYNDVVTFSYKLDKEGYTGNIKIFDSEGRPVRHLMKSELLGTSGNISWDGFSDERQKAVIGIYVIFFEAFTPDGDTVRSKKTCVLTHHLN